VKLAQRDLKLFFKLHSALLAYANRRLKVVDGVDTPERFMNAGLEKQVKIRDALQDNLALIDSFVRDNPFGFSGDELDVVAGWRYLVKGTFYLLRYLKKYAIFLDDMEPSRAYGVLALTNAFEEILGQEPPIRLEAVLLPFKGQIVYDGFLAPYRIYFGRGFREDLNEECREAKDRFGIIMSLPHAAEKERTDAERLRFYLRSEGSRLMYEEEIEKLTSSETSLMKIYHHEMGKIHARKLGKRLREIGVNAAWFAVLEGTIIASGATREQVDEVLKDILPAGKRELAYIFHLRKK
jgi:hypothetical protein